jgi:hypothetical protein
VRGVGGSGAGRAGPAGILAVRGRRASPDAPGGYLPTNLTAPEIAGELHVSVNTVKTHMRTLYAKLATHRRAETVVRARDLGLLAPHAFRS